MHGFPVCAWAEWSGDVLQDTQFNGSLFLFDRNKDTAIVFRRHRFVQLIGDFFFKNSSSIGGQVNHKFLLSGNQIIHGEGTAGFQLLADGLVIDGDHSETLVRIIAERKGNASPVQNGVDDDTPDCKDAAQNEYGDPSIFFAQEASS